MTTHSRDSQLGIMAILAVGLLLVLPILAMGIGMMGVGTMGGHWGGHWSGMSSWFPVVGFLVPLLLVVGLLLSGAYVILGPMDDRSADEEALAELRRAYAGGELSEEDYQELRDHLESDR